MAIKVGEVNTYFADSNLAGINVMVDFKVGDKVKIGDLEFVVEHMEIAGKKVEEAKRGDAVKIKTPGAVKKDAGVFKL
ncbi:MAG: hypothetical protein KAT49_01195 [Methanomicrobia archaeon]|nr:hypothetical protein [Methanomicrobia archaeon]MCK4636475.1 hypothetical protein [Methanomicrobia archaeon]